MSANGANGELVATPSAGTAVRVGFGERTLTTQAETSSTAVAAQQTAMVQAAFIMAERRPRDIDQVRYQLLQTCKRTRFAEAGMYRKPVGKEKNERTGQWEEKIAEGLSIRFAEEAARCMRNLRIDSYTIYDDPRKKIVKFVVLDLESNTEWSKTVTLEKTTERRQLKKGQVAMATRINSYGETVYIVDATQEEMTKREGAEASKGWRDGILKNVPADIKEECLDLIKATIASDTTADPEAAKKKVLDGFAGVGVTPTQLRDYVGHELTTLNPAELTELRTIFRSIHDGETSWATLVEERAELMAEKAAEAKRADKAASTPAAGAKPASVDGAVAASKARREAAARASKSEPPHDPKTGEVKADPRPPVETPATSGKPAPVSEGIVMSTVKQRKELSEAIFHARLEEGAVCKWFGVDELVALSGLQVEDALSRIKILEETTIADVRTALEKAKLGEGVIPEWFDGKTVDQLSAEERAEAIRTAVEATP